MPQHVTSAFIPSPEIKHVRSQKAGFALTNSAGCCLAVQDLPAPPKAFLMPRKQHFMKMLSSLSLSEFVGFLVTQA